MADTCVVHGNADMYGIGIRLGFYLQWLASILANFLMIEPEIKSSRFALSSYAGAVIIALAVQTARNATSNLDSYVVILLCFGASYAQIPIFLWRVLTCFNANWDPTRWTAAASGTLLSMFSTLVLVAIAVLQYVFWGGLESESERAATGCHEYGFLLVRVSLYSTALKAVNLAFSSLLLIISSLGWIQWFFSSRKGGFLAQEKVQSTGRTTILIRLRCLINLVVAVTVITGTELTLSWNHVQDISDLDTPGQLISFILGVVVFSRVIWSWAKNRRPDNSVSTKYQPVPMYPVAPGRPDVYKEDWVSPGHMMPYPTITRREPVDGPSTFPGGRVAASSGDAMTAGSTGYGYPHHHDVLTPSPDESLNYIGTTAFSGPPPVPPVPMHLVYKTHMFSSGLGPSELPR